MPANRQMVVLNVEGTVLYNNSDINSLLLESLVESGINEVYLFTNASLNDVIKYGQEVPFLNVVDLVAHIESQGIHVKRVITPADPFLQVGTLGLSYRKFYEPQINKRKRANRPLDLQDCTEDSLEFMFAQLEWDSSTYVLSEMTKALKNPSIPRKKPQLGLCLYNKQAGKTEAPPHFFYSLQSAKEFFALDANRAKYCLKQQFNDSVTMEVNTERMSTADPVGMMMQHLLDNTDTAGQTTLNYLDARKPVIQEVLSLSRKFKQLEFHSCLVNDNFSQATHPSEKNRYLQFLNRAPMQTETHPKPADDSCCFILRVLAHPYSLPAFLLVLGSLGLALGGIGLAGIGLSLGLSTFLSQVVLAAGATAALTGIGLGMYRFFSASCKPADDSRPKEAKALVSGAPS